MATRALKPLTFITGRDGKSPEFEDLTVLGTEIEGELIVKTDNASVVCGDDAVIMTHLVTTSGANSLPGKTLTMPLLILKPGDTFEISVWNSTAATAVVADTLLDAQAGYPVVKKTVSGVTAWVLDIGNIGSTPSVRLRTRLATDSATDQYPRVRVEFLNTVTQSTS